jgi:hypothetical protein
MPAVGGGPGRDGGLERAFEELKRPNSADDTSHARGAAVRSTLDDAKRVMDVLGKRLARYGLALHPSKTQLVDFRFHRPGGVRHPDTDSATFDFLGFSHIWAKSKKGVNGVRQVTIGGPSL